MIINQPGALALLLLLLAPPLTLADGDSDAVNERLPVDNAELEAHWQVDCANAWHNLREKVTQAPDGGKCSIPQKLRDDIQLCAFIYQAPGDDSQHRCPDYRGASHYLGTGGEAMDCANLRASVQWNVDCEMGIQ